MDAVTEPSAEPFPDHCENARAGQFDHALEQVDQADHREEAGKGRDAVTRQDGVIHHHQVERSAENQDIQHEAQRDDRHDRRAEAYQRFSKFTAHLGHSAASNWEAKSHPPLNQES